MLQRLRQERSSSGDLLDFQPLLAKAVFGLDRLHHAAGRERKQIVRNKAHYTPAYLRRRLQQLHAYQGVLHAAASRGRQLGDLFAWIFYQREELRVFTQVEQSPVGPIADGVGGLVELDFVRRFRFFPGDLMPLYHGTTNFLRVGDVSLIHVGTFELAGIGELKAGPVANGSAEVKLILQGTERLRSLIDSSRNPQEPVTTSPTQPLNHRLDRQLKRSQHLLRLSPPPRLVTAHVTPDYRPLKGLFQEVCSKGIVFRRVNPSLAIAATHSSPRASLYHQLTRHLPRRTMARIERLSIEEFYYLATTARDDNALWIGFLDLSYFPGTEPLFWSAVEPQLTDGLFRQTTVVVTVFNPARFIAELRAQGFLAQIAPKSRIRIAFDHGPYRIELLGVDYFMRLIQACLVPPESVASLLRTMVDSLDPEVLRPGVKIRFLPLHRLERRAERADAPVQTVG